MRALLLVSGLLASYLGATEITIKPGETLTIRAHQKTTVQCTATDIAVVPASAAICHKFHSDNECAGMGVGTRCKKSEGAKKMMCVSTGFFAGAPNCRCR